MLDSYEAFLTGLLLQANVKSPSSSLEKQRISKINYGRASTTNLIFQTFCWLIALLLLYSSLHLDLQSKSVRGCNFWVFNWPATHFIRRIVMLLDEVKKEFVQQVKLRGYDDKYIDKAEEKEILQLALTKGVTVDSARSALAQVCESNGYILESVFLREIKDLLEIQAGNDGKIDQKEFNDAVALAKRKSQGKKNDVQIKRMICELIDQNSFKVKTGMFSNWYSVVKKEVGMG